MQIVFLKEIIHEFGAITRKCKWPLLVGLVLRIGWVLFALHQNGEKGLEQFDSQIYLHISETFSQTGQMAFSGPNGELYAIHNRVPGYPFLLSLLGKGGVLVLQLLAFYGVVLMLWKVVRMMQLSVLAGVLAVWVYALDIPGVVFSGNLMTETLFCFLLMTSIFLLFKAIKSRKSYLFLIAGVIIGCSAYLRPISFLLPLILMVITWLIWKISLRKTVLILAGGLMVILPWVIRNKITYDKWMFSSVAATNLVYYRVGGIIAEKEGRKLSEVQQNLSRKITEQQGGDPMKIVEYQYQLAIDTIMNNKVLFAKHTSLGGIRVLFYPIRASIDYQLGWSRQNSMTHDQSSSGTSGFTWMLVVVQGIMLLIMWLGIAVALIRVRSKELVLLLLVSAYFLLLSSGYEADARFRIPITPILIMTSAFGYHFLQKRKYIHNPDYASADQGK